MFGKDSEEEIYCKSIYNFHIFSQFNTYSKFRQYAILKGFYNKKTYNTEMFSIEYLKQNHPEFLLDYETTIIQTKSKWNICIIL